jgi:hypothetical protein
MEPTLITIAKGSFAVFSILFCLSCNANDNKNEQTKTLQVATATQSQNTAPTQQGMNKNMDTSLTVRKEIAPVTQPTPLTSTTTKPNVAPLSKKRIVVPKVYDSLPISTPTRSIFDPEKKNIDGYTPKNDN